MSYRDLDVYKRSYRLALEVHKLSLELPQQLQFDLADQIRRASRSITSNIVEGYGRAQSDQDTIRFIRMSLGSNDEVLFNLQFIKDLNLMSEDQFTYFFSEYTILGKQIYQLLKSFGRTDN